MNKPYFWFAFQCFRCHDNAMFDTGWISSDGHYHYSLLFKPPHERPELDHTQYRIYWDGGDLKPVLRLALKLDTYMLQEIHHDTFWMMSYMGRHLWRHPVDKHTAQYQYQFGGNGISNDMANHIVHLIQSQRGNTQ